MPREVISTPEAPEVDRPGVLVSIAMVAVTD
jgi:hypothetical protein